MGLIFLRASPPVPRCERAWGEGRESYTKNDLLEFFSLSIGVTCYRDTLINRLSGMGQIVKHLDPSATGGLC